MCCHFAIRRLLRIETPRLAGQFDCMFFPLLVCLLGQSAVEQDPQRAAEQLHQKAGALVQQGHYDQALRHEARALAILEELPGTNPIDLSGPHYNLAVIYLAQGKLSAAEREVGFARRRAGGGAAQRDGSRIAVLLARIHFQKGRYAEAERELRTALSGLDGVGRATALNDLGMVRAARNDLAGARELLEGAVALRWKFENSGSATLGRLLANLALVCSRQGDLDAARSYYGQAIGMLEATAPDSDRTHLGMALAEFSEVLRKSGRKPEAKAAGQRARALLRESVEPSMHTVDVRSLR
jgi:tetratricopeptide (TPR) repeat protein